MGNYTVYMKKGLKNPPEKVTLAKQKYFKSGDIIGNWFRDTLKKATPDKDTGEYEQKIDTKNELFLAFCASNTGNQVRHAQFLKELEAIVGKRDQKDKAKTTGLYKNGNENYLQGYEWIEKDEPIYTCDILDH